MSKEFDLMEIPAIIVFEEYIIHCRDCKRCKVGLNEFMKNSEDCKDFVNRIKNCRRFGGIE